LAHSHQLREYQAHHQSRQAVHGHSHRPGLERFGHEDKNWMMNLKLKTQTKLHVPSSKGAGSVRSQLRTDGCRSWNLVFGTSLGLGDWGLVLRLGAALPFAACCPILTTVNASVTQLTDQLIVSYAKVGGINHLDGKNLPSKTAIASITCDLLRLLFPGFFDDRMIHSSELKVEMVSLMDSVLERLEDEIYKSLEYSTPEGLAKKDLRRVARDFTLELLASLPSTRELLKTDVDAAYTGDPAALSHEEIIVAYPFVETIAVQRVAHELYKKQIALIPRIMTEWAHARTGLELHPGAQIGSHFFVDHCTGTVIGETCIIGKHVKVYHGVTLGAKSTADVENLRGKKRHPTIEDRVTIYPGATILGGDTVIGEGSTIGGNVFLTTSVPPHSLVVFEGVTVKVMNKREREMVAVDFQI
jgi:serine O-acetyltransferase